MAPPTTQSNIDIIMADIHAQFVNLGETSQKASEISVLVYDFIESLERQDDYFKKPQWSYKINKAKNEPPYITIKLHTSV